MINFGMGITGVESVQMWDDIMKFLTVAVIVHMLSYAVDNEGELFDERALKMFLYIVIGVVVYNLVIRRLFMRKDEKRKK